MLEFLTLAKFLAVLQIRIRSDPGLFGRFRIQIRILLLINYLMSTFLVCV
jgi:hypothetical protein